MSGEWPDKPSLRFLIHWSLCRDELCEPGLCHDAPDDGGRCDHCPLDRLDVAQSSAASQLLRRARDLRFALEMGIKIGLDEIKIDEFMAMELLMKERGYVDSEKSSELVSQQAVQ